MINCVHREQVFQTFIAAFIPHLIFTVTNAHLIHISPMLTCPSKIWSTSSLSIYHLCLSIVFVYLSSLSFYHLLFLISYLPSSISNHPSHPSHPSFIIPQNPSPFCHLFFVILYLLSVIPHPSTINFLLPSISHLPSSTIYPISYILHPPPPNHYPTITPPLPLISSPP